MKVGACWHLDDTTGAAWRPLMFCICCLNYVWSGHQLLQLYWIWLQHCLPLRLPKCCVVCGLKAPPQVVTRRQFEIWLLSFRFSCCQTEQGVEISSLTWSRWISLVSEWTLVGRWWWGGDIPGCSVTSTLAMLTPMSSPQAANSIHTGCSCWHAGHHGA